MLVKVFYEKGVARCPLKITVVSRAGYDFRFYCRQRRVTNDQARLMLLNDVCETRRYKPNNEVYYPESSFLVALESMRPRMYMGL